MKKLVVFDLDGTLAESKSSLDAEMAALFNQLLVVRQGGRDFRRQLAAISETSALPPSGDERLKNLSLLPTCGTQFYKYENGWDRLYSEDFTAEQKEKIVSP